jgi:hypothetical protein
LLPTLVKVPAARETSVGSGTLGGEPDAKEA